MNVMSDNLSGMEQQHRRIDALVEAACKELNSGGGSDNLRRVLTRLLGFTRIHFFQEEELMHRCGYEGLERHAQTHKMLFDRLAELTAETFNSFRESTRERLLRFLEKDLRFHIAEDTHAWETGQLEKRLACQPFYDHKV